MISLDKHTYLSLSILLTRFIRYVKLLLTILFYSFSLHITDGVHIFLEFYLQDRHNYQQTCILQLVTSIDKIRYPWLWIIQYKIRRFPTIYTKESAIVRTCSGVSITSDKMAIFRAETCLPYRDPDITTPLILASFLPPLIQSRQLGPAPAPVLRSHWTDPHRCCLGLARQVGDGSTKSIEEQQLCNSAYLGLILLVSTMVARFSFRLTGICHLLQETYIYIYIYMLISLQQVGGISTSFPSLKANMSLLIAVAITGILAPIGLNLYATRHCECDAAAMLCCRRPPCAAPVLARPSRSWGPLDFSRRGSGVVLTSAAMLDDVVGLVMVQVMSNLGGSTTSDFGAVTVVIRPVFVSVALCGRVSFALLARPQTGDA